MAELQVNLLSPAKIVTKVTATQVQTPAVNGDLGILPGHTKFITELGVGVLKIEGTPSGEQSYFVAGGYLEVNNDVVTLLADVVEKPNEIDRERAAKAKKRAEERLSNESDIDIARAHAALLRATQRLAIVSSSFNG
jgi:F-type H+-transporting ATPase subunit epsilon